jgi:DNA-binding transcriptional regulator YiaG
MGRIMTPDEIRAMRGALTQKQAGALIDVSRRCWQNWEAPTDSPAHRKMPPMAVKLFRSVLDRNGGG